MVGRDFSGNEEARVQQECQEVQGEMGEHQQVLQKGEGEQQEETGRFQDMSVFPPAGCSLQGEEGAGGGEAAGEHGGAVDGAAGAAMASSTENNKGGCGHGRRRE